VKNPLCLLPQAATWPSAQARRATSCLSSGGRGDLPEPPSNATMLPLPFPPFSRILSLFSLRAKNLAPATAEPRHFRHPRAPPTCREAPARRPMCPRRGNRATVPGITAVRRRFPAGTEVHRHRIGPCRPSSDHTDLTGGLLVSFQSRRTSPRPPSCPTVDAGEPAGALPAMLRRPRPAR
jgi:hypothetical protein